MKPAGMVAARAALDAAIAPGRAWPVIPGVPSAGHVTAGGAWHPGAIDGCAKCQP
jgi:hypothetical protein